MKGEDRGISEINYEKEFSDENVGKQILTEKSYEERTIIVHFLEQVLQIAFFRWFSLSAWEAGFHPSIIHSA